MPIKILEHIKVSELPARWRKELQTYPNQTFTVTIEAEQGDSGVEFSNKKEQIEFATFPLGVKGEIIREEIYDHL